MAWFLFGTVNALADTTALKAGMFIDTRALKLVVFRFVGGSTDATGNERLRARAPFGVVPETPAALALFDKRE